MSPVAYRMSGLMHVKYRKLPNKLFKFVASTFFALSNFDNFILHSTNVPIGLQLSILNFLSISFA